MEQEIAKKDGCLNEKKGFESERIRGKIIEKSDEIEGKNLK